MGISLGELKAAMTAAKLKGGQQAVDDLTGTIRVLFNEADGPLEVPGLLSGNPSRMAGITYSDLRGGAGNEYSYESFNKLPKGTLGLNSPAARSKAMASPAVRVKAMARSQAGMSPKASAIAKRRAILKNMKNRK